MGWSFWDDYEERNYEAHSPHRQGVAFDMSTAPKHKIIFSEFVLLSRLSKRERRMIKSPGFTKGHVDVRYTDDDLHNAHVFPCPIVTGAQTSRQWKQWQQGPAFTPSHLWCTCTDPCYGFFALCMTEMFVFQWPPVERAPVLWRYVQRPLTLADAIRFKEIDEQTALVLADGMMERGDARGEQVVKQVIRMRQPQL